MRTFLFAFAASTALFSQGVLLYTPQVDRNLRTYRPIQQAAAVIESSGTDSLTDAWNEWMAGFKALQPKAQFKVNQGLSSVAIKAFMENQVALIHLGRELTPDENQAFQKKFGYNPTKVVVCFDAYIVFVNAANPIRDIGMDQLDAAYSTTRLGGYKASSSNASVDTWGDLGVGGDLAKRPIRAYMRAEGTASRSTIRDMVLLKGSYKPSVVDMEDWSGIAEAVMTDISGLGIGTLSNWLSRNKTLAVTPFHAKEPVPPSQESVISGKYPLSRTYYFYLNRAPDQTLSPTVTEFLQYVLSFQGQTAVVQASLVPLPAEIAQGYLKRLRIN
jgi:phosphate transport system substrate-binding protein